MTRLSIVGLAIVITLAILAIVEEDIKEMSQ